MEVVVRAAVVYGILWILLRAMGKRELSEVTAFELVILVVLGDIIQQGVTQEDMSITGSALAVSTMVVLAVGSSVVSRRYSGTRSVLEGRPTVVLRDGRVMDEILRLQRITLDEVNEAARKRGYTTLDGLAWIIVETDGKFSFIERSATDDDADGSGGDGDQDDDEGGLE